MVGKESEGFFLNKRLEKANMAKGELIYPTKKIERTVMGGLSNHVIRDSPNSKYSSISINQTPEPKINCSEEERRHF